MADQKRKVQTDSGDLLAACKLAFKFMATGIIMPSERELDVIEKLRKAIAKAEGTDGENG